MRSLSEITQASNQVSSPSSASSLQTITAIGHSAELEMEVGGGPKYAPPPPGRKSLQYPKAGGRQNENNILWK